MSEQPTKEQWKALEDGLLGSLGSVNLLCDGYEITLRKMPVSESRLAIFVYVDGWLRGEWLITDCEERRRFMRARSGFFWSAKQRRELKKIPKSRLTLDPDKRWTTYECCWPTFAPLRRHLARENKSIKIISINGEAMQ